MGHRLQGFYLGLGQVTVASYRAAAISPVLIGQPFSL